MLGAAVLVLVTLAIVVAFFHGRTLTMISGLFGGNPMAVGAVLFVAMWLMIFFLVPAGAAMSLAGLAGAVVLLGPHAGLIQFGHKTMHVIANANLAVIPLFLIMGNLASVSGLSGDIYRLAHVLVGDRRGGLALATVGGCAGFGAVTGSWVATARIVAGLIVELGYDLIWWGIVMVVVVEMGLITPPFGVNVFVIKSMLPDVPLSTIYRGVLPFIGADIVKFILLALFPTLTLWLPATMFE